jgi:peroxiredoxin Q/BCP
MSSTTNESPALDHLPDLQVISTQGEFNLKDLNNRFTILYFYPKDSTPGCSTQARDFRDLQADFAKLGAKVYGVSRDSMKSHEKFTTNECLPFPLISDSEEVLCRQFDVIKQKNMYGKIVQGIERSTFLFNAEGQLIHSWRKVKAAGHAQMLLEYLASL